MKLRFENRAANSLRLAAALLACMGMSFCTGSVRAWAAQTTPVITWPIPKAITYGTALSAVQLDATTGVPGTFVYSFPAGWVLSAGTWPVSVTFTPTDTTDYTTAKATVYQVVIRAVLTVAAFSYRRTYGGALPALGYNIFGYVNGDTAATAFTGTPSVTTTAVQGSPAGGYPITVTAGTLSSTNYTFQFRNGTLTIAPAVLNFAVYNYDRKYGKALQTFGYSVDGYVNGDTAATAFTGAPSVTTNAIKGSPPGNYPISITAGTLASTNYTFRFFDATLTITGAPVTTTLTVTSAGSPVTTVGSGSVVTLTATVESGGIPITPGQVKFCDAAAKYCTDIHRLALAQLTKAGTAAFKFRPGVGSHSYIAEFVPPKGKPPSNSGTAALTVSGLQPSATGLAQTYAGAGVYTLTATVGGNGAAKPTGNVSFVDASNGNAVLATAPLGGGGGGFEFVNSSNAATGVYPTSVATGDFNGDGIPDLAVADADTGLTVLLGNGDGTFKAAAQPITNQLALVAVGDFNGDGIPDLVVTNEYGGAFAVLLGNGDGTFTVGSNILDYGGAMSLVVGDFNGDGILDVAVLTYDQAYGIYLFLGNGDGTFKPLLLVTTPAYSPIAMAAGDFNNDGILDLAVVDQASNTVTILLGNGDGTFTPAAASPATGVYPTAIAVADFNGDGNLDLVVTNAGGTYGCCASTVMVLLGDGTGAFAPASEVSLDLGQGATPVAIAIGDFNGDGIPGVAVANEGWGSDFVLQGNGDGSWALAALVPTGAQSNSIAVADFNGDGVSDFAATQNYANLVTVFLAETSIANATANSVTVPGTDKVVAQYPGDSNYKPSNSGVDTVTAAAAPRK